VALVARGVAVLGAEVVGDSVVVVEGVALLIVVGVVGGELVVPLELDAVGELLVMPVVQPRKRDLAEDSTVVRSPMPLRPSASRPVDQGDPKTRSLRLTKRAM
jgi:hypothetical protein